MPSSRHYIDDTNVQQFPRREYEEHSHLVCCPVSRWLRDKRLHKGQTPHRGEISICPRSSRPPTGSGVLTAKIDGSSWAAEDIAGIPSGTSTYNGNFLHISGGRAVVGDTAEAETIDLIIDLTPREEASFRVHMHSAPYPRSGEAQHSDGMTASATQAAHSQEQSRSRRLTWRERSFREDSGSTELESMGKRTLSARESLMSHGCSNDPLSMQWPVRRMRTERRPDRWSGRAGSFVDSKKLPLIRRGLNAQTKKRATRHWVALVLSKRTGRKTECGRRVPPMEHEPKVCWQNDFVECIEIPCIGAEPAKAFYPRIRSVTVTSLQIGMHRLTFLGYTLVTVTVRPWIAAKGPCILKEFC